MQLPDFFASDWSTTICHVHHHSLLFVCLYVRVLVCFGFWEHRVSTMDAKFWHWSILCGSMIILYHILFGVVSLQFDTRRRAYCCAISVDGVNHYFFSWLYAWEWFATVVLPAFYTSMISPKVSWFACDCVKIHLHFSSWQCCCKLGWTYNGGYIRRSRITMTMNEMSGEYRLLVRVTANHAFGMVRWTAGIVGSFPCSRRITEFCPTATSEIATLVCGFKYV